MLVNLNQIFEREKGCAAGFNVFGFEDAKAVIMAAENRGVPVILMVNKPAAAHMPIPVLGQMLSYLAENAAVSVCVHLDHSTSMEDIQLAVDNRFTSVMFDGSQLPFEENMRLTKQVIETVRVRGISVEAEVGSVGYSDGQGNVRAEYTDPAEAKLFFEKTKVDALAVAVGTVHRMTSATAHIQFERIEEIRNNVDVPLVIHGSSGVKNQDLRKLAESGIRKINLGTCLRQAFGYSMRKTMNEDLELFDRLQMFKIAMEAVFESACEKIDAINGQN